MLEKTSLPDPDNAVVIRSLGKQFGDKIAVNGINLTIPAGSFYGFVGPNGAGKTTTMSMMTGLLRPDHGQVWVHGINMWEFPQQAKSVLGVLVDGAAVFPRLTGTQLITYSGLLRGMAADVVAERVPDLLRVMDLQEAANKMVADYSAGMTKKISLAAAMIHSPQVLILDEPFEAVDPVSSARIRAILNDYVNSGGTVMISSHVMDLVERTCDHVAVIDKGQVLASGSMAEVTDGVSLEDRFVGMVSSEQSGKDCHGFAPSSPAVLIDVERVSTFRGDDDRGDLFCPGIFIFYRHGLCSGVSGGRYPCPRNVLYRPWRSLCPVRSCEPDRLDGRTDHLFFIKPLH